MWIELIMHMSGTRANGDRYPPGWTPFKVEDWEGEHLIRGGMAREIAAPSVKAPAPLPEPASAREPVQEPVQEPVPVTAFGDTPVPEGVLASEAQFTEPAPEADAEPPAPADSKLAWVSYAVSQGEDPDVASRMTKADLQSRYGGRL